MNTACWWAAGILDAHFLVFKSHPSFLDFSFLCSNTKCYFADLPKLYHMSFVWDLHLKNTFCSFLQSLQRWKDRSDGYHWPYHQLLISTIIKWEHVLDRMIYAFFLNPNEWYVRRARLLNVAVLVHVNIIPLLLARLNIEMTSVWVRWGFFIQHTQNLKKKKKSSIMIFCINDHNGDKMINLTIFMIKQQT